MSSRAVPAAIRAAEKAISAEVRGAIARSGLTHEDIQDTMGVSQSWFSRRYSGRVPWKAAEMQMVLNIVDEDITRVYAAGALAIAKAQGTRPTNLDLSGNACIVAQRQGLWARRGYELAKRIFPDFQVADRAA